MNRIQSGAASQVPADVLSKFANTLHTDWSDFADEKSVKEAKLLSQNIQDHSGTATIRDDLFNHILHSRSILGIQKKNVNTTGDLYKIVKRASGEKMTLGSFLVESYPDGRDEELVQHPSQGVTYTGPPNSVMRSNLAETEKDTYSVAFPRFAFTYESANSKFKEMKQQTEDLQELTKKKVRQVFNPS